MQRVLNMVFVILVGLFFTVVFSNAVLVAVTNDSAITARSYLEGRSYQEAPSMTMRTVLEGKFQNEVEQYIADRIPARDLFLVGNSTIQGRTIELSNMPFGYDVYHTFYGSKTLYTPGQRALVQTPQRKSSKVVKKLKDFSKNLSGIVQQYPNIKFVVIVVDRSNTSRANPASTLVSNPWFTSDAAIALESYLEGFDNARVVCWDYDNPQSFFHDYFKSDHHWNLYGACAAYNEISSFLGKKTMDLGERTIVSDTQFYGSNARNGLFLLSDENWDVEYDFGDLSLTRETGQAIQANNHSAWFDLDLGQRQYVSYQTCYGGDASRESTLHSKGGSGTALMIADSFGASLRLMVGEQYKTTFVFDDLRRGQKSEKSNLRERIDSTGAETVIFVAWSDDYQSLTTRMPNYFAI